jgi:hypothetical protein
MRHERHYTLEEANESLDWIVECLARLRAARAKLMDTAAREALSEAAPTNGGGAPGQVISEGFLAVRDELVALRDREVVLRDLDRGLVDFPSVRDGREVYLCWEEGEEEVAFWHDIDTGFAGRRPVDDG